MGGEVKVGGDDFGENNGGAITTTDTVVLHMGLKEGLMGMINNVLLGGIGGKGEGRQIVVDLEVLFGEGVGVLLFATLDDIRSML